MGGHVGVESDGRNGTCFWLELRISETPAPPAPTTVARRPAARPAGAAGPR